MIFLNIVLDDSISSTEKTQMILEVLGNSKYRPSTAKYIRMNVSKLIDICGNEASRDEEQPNKLRYNFQKRLNKISSIMKRHDKLKKRETKCFLMTGY